MKKYLLLLLCINSYAFAQNAEIMRIETRNRIYKGKIDDQYRITLYLEAVSSSPNIGYIHGLKGWYAYDKIGTPIPLAGVQNQESYLFASSNNQFLNDLIEFEYKGAENDQRLDTHNSLAHISNEMKEATERFVLEVVDGKIKGQWFSNGKTLDVQLSGKDLNFISYHNILKYGNKHIDLNTMLDTDRAYVDIESVSSNGQNMILNYEYQASLNYYGRCGGGTNSGKIALRFDEAGSLLGYDKFSFEECYAERYVQDLTKITETITDYEIMDYSANIEFKVRVDSENGTIVRKEN